MYKLPPAEKGKNILHERHKRDVYDLHRKKVCGPPLRLFCACVLSVACVVAQLLVSCATFPCALGPCPEAPVPGVGLLEQIDGMTSHLAKMGFSKAPKMIPKVVRANLKKRMHQDERLASIEAENARLLSQMTRIMDAPDTLSRLRRPAVTSLNVVARRREMERVTHENLRLLKQLEAAPAYYNHRVWEAQRREQEHILSYMGMYKYGDGTGVRARTKTRSHTDVDDVWLRSVTSLSRKSALSLPELTKGRDGRFARTENPGDPWALPVLPGREDLSAAGQGLGTGGNVSLAETSAVMNATASPTRPAPVKSLDKLRADSSSEDDEEDEEQAHDVKKADEPIPTAPAVAASKPSAPDADDQEEAEAPAPTATPPAASEHAGAAEPPAQEPLANLPTSPEQQDAPPPAVAGPSAPSTDDATAAGLVDPEPALAATLDPREATQTAPDESAPAAEAAAAEAEGSHEPVEAAMPETTGEAEPASEDAAADAALTQAPADE